MTEPDRDLPRPSPWRPVLVALCVAGLLVPACAGPPRSGHEPGLPGEYRSWPLASVSVNYEPGHPLRGVHAIHVSPEGRELSHRGGPYPPGTTWVLVLSEIHDDGTSIVPGDRLRTFVMHKVGEAHAPETGGWSYRLYRASDHRPIPIDDPVADCHACHREVASTDFVFTTFDF